MTNEDYKAMVSQLLKASREGRVQWRQSPRHGTFFVALSHNSISICRYWSEEDAPFTGDAPFEGYALAIIDSRGTELDGYYVPRGSEDFDAMEELYTLALRKARKIDATLRELNDLLSKSDGTIGEEELPF